MAERLLSPELTNFGPPPATVRLPPLPFALPQPAGARLLGSAVRPAFTGTPLPTVGESIDAIVDAPLAPREALDFYEQALTAQGWSAPNITRRPRGGGFQPGPVGETTILCQSASGPSVILTAGIRQPGMTEVRLRIETSSASRGPCAEPPAVPPAGSFPATLLPNLVLPPEARSRSGMGSISSGPDLTSSSSSFDVRMSPAELEAWFGRQLVEAGWTRLDGGVSAGYAWSQWRPAPTTEGDWLATLAIAAGPAADQRTAMLYTINGQPFAGSGPARPFGAPTLPLVP